MTAACGAAVVHLCMFPLLFILWNAHRCIWHCQQAWPDSTFVGVWKSTDHFLFASYNENDLDKHHVS
jgi:hypothetical protein